MRGLKLAGSNAENWGDHQMKNSCMNNSVEAIIPLNEGHQGLLKLHVHYGWGFQYGVKGGCITLHCFREVQCQ